MLELDVAREPVAPLQVRLSNVNRCKNSWPPRVRVETTVKQNDGAQDLLWGDWAVDVDVRA